MYLTVVYPYQGIANCGLEVLGMTVGVFLFEWTVIIIHYLAVLKNLLS